MSTQDIAFVRGQTEEWVFTLTTAAGVAEATTGVTNIEFEVKRYPGKADPAVLALAFGSGVTARSPQTGADVGVCDIIVTAEQTFALAAGSWSYDVFVTRGDGSRKRAMSGTLTVSDVVNFL